jgi:hypothetical protein
LQGGNGGPQTSCERYSNSSTDCPLSKENLTKVSVELDEVTSCEEDTSRGWHHPDYVVSEDGKKWRIKYD